MAQAEKEPSALFAEKTMNTVGTRLALGISIAVFAVATPVASTIAQAQSADAPQMQDLVNELNTELERGEKDRLIDPWFLRDLRETISRYDNPWDTLIFEDKFDGRGAQPSAPWQVTAGEYLVDWRYGMRSVVKPVAKTVAQAETAPESPLGQLVGALLKGATGTSQDAQATTAEPETEIVPATAIAPKAISNAFAIRVELTSRPVEGVDPPRLEFGPYQGENATAGYRLALIPGQAPALELTSISSRGTVSTLEVHDQPLNLGDGKAHVIEWTRDRAGKMVIKVDGAEIVNVTDRRFTESFDGLSVTNRGGDFALRSVRIDGAAS